MILSLIKVLIYIENKKAKCITKIMQRIFSSTYNNNNETKEKDSNN